ncbi:MAG: rhomboid family intramembrane serine protease [Prevotellaceae bacterium]|nr:rhomboid family intramembrane serine protease [Prevotellaceae bacterium]
MNQQMPPVTKNLLIINCLAFLAQFVFERRGVDLTEMFGLHFVLADNFRLWQLVTYMFLHGSLTHLFFNMFSLWMFGRIIEQVFGRERFLVYYMVCGVGAGLCQELWQGGEYLLSGMQGYDYVNVGAGMPMPMGAFLNTWTTIGASGACYGILLAFGMTFPEERIMLLIPPIPMKAKYFVVGYAAIELFSAFSSNSNIAHFAHLGGMLFGLALILWWRRRTRRAPAFRSWETYRPRRKTWRERLSALVARLTPRRRKEKPRGGREADYDYNIRQRQKEARLDEILDKVKRSGYESLTKEEKEELFRNSR